MREKKTNPLIASVLIPAEFIPWKCHLEPVWPVLLSQCDRWRVVNGFNSEVPCSLQIVKSTSEGLCEHGDPSPASMDERLFSCVAVCITLMFPFSWLHSTFRPALPARDTGPRHEGFHQEPSDCNTSIIKTPCVNSVRRSAGAS